MDSILKLPVARTVHPRAGSFHVKTVPRHADGADDIRLTFASNGVAQTLHMDVYVRRLRDAITHEGEPDVIRTVRTAGYALNIE